MHIGNYLITQLFSFIETNIRKEVVFLLAQDNAKYFL